MCIPADGQFVCGLDWDNDVVIMYALCMNVVITNMPENSLYYGMRDLKYVANDSNVVSKQYDRIYLVSSLRVHDIHLSQHLPFLMIQPNPNDTYLNPKSP